VKIWIQWDDGKASTWDALSVDIVSGPAMLKIVGYEGPDGYEIKYVPLRGVRMWAEQYPRATDRLMIREGNQP
jgi:hypothetical protein